MATKNIELKTVLASCTLVMAAEIGWGVFISGEMGLPGLGILRFFQVTLVLGCVYHMDKTFTPIGLSPSRILPGVRNGLIWSFIFGLITCAMFLVLFLNDINPFTLLRIRLPQDPWQKILYFLVGGLIAPVAEEIFFRGILYGFFRRWGVVFAVFLSTLIFAVAHPGVSYVQITGGIVFAISYEKEKNLMVPITIHTLGNLSLFSLPLLT